MTEPIVIPPGGGEIVGDSPDRRVEILCEHDALHATWSRFGPRRAGAELHVHRHHHDAFYVLEGELTVMLGLEGEEVVVPAGTLARVPPLVVHGFRNGSDAGLRYLNFHAPGRGFADYLRALRDGRTLVYDQEPPPPDGGRPTSEAVVEGSTALLADVDEIGIAVASVHSGSPPRLHRRHVQAFYVLEGALAVAAGDREIRAQAGTWMHVPPGVPHAVAPADDRPVRFLDVHAPNTASDQQPAP